MRLDARRRAQERRDRRVRRPDQERRNPGNRCVRRLDQERRNPGMRRLTPTPIPTPPLPTRHPARQERRDRRVRRLDQERRNPGNWRVRRLDQERRNPGMRRLKSRNYQSHSANASAGRQQGTQRSVGAACSGLVVVKLALSSFFYFSLNSAWATAKTMAAKPSRATAKKQRRRKP